MEAFTELQEHIDDGSMRLIQMVGVPRSMSTALGRALNETDQPSIYVNEPFNRDNSDPGQAARFILDACKISEKSEDGQLVVITKNMASYLDTEAFKLLDSLAGGTILNVRHPLIQIGSLLTRIVNDIFIGPGEAGIGQDGLKPYVNRACDFLMESPKSRNFSKTGWQALGTHASCEPRSSRLTVDGDQFVGNPVDCLKSVCQHLGLTYGPSMIDGWSKGFVNVINRDVPDETRRSAWTQTVANSTGVIAIDRPAIDIDDLPHGLQEHLMTVALPVYERLVASDEPG